YGWQYAQSKLGFTEFSFVMQQPSHSPEDLRFYLFLSPLSAPPPSFAAPHETKNLTQPFSPPKSKQASVAGKLPGLAGSDTTLSSKGRCETLKLESHRLSSGTRLFTTVPAFAPALLAKHGLLSTCCTTISISVESSVLSPPAETGYLHQPICFDSSPDCPQVRYYPIRLPVAMTERGLPQRAVIEPAGSIDI